MFFESILLSVKYSLKSAIEKIDFSNHPSMKDDVTTKTMRTRMHTIFKWMAEKSVQHNYLPLFARADDQEFAGWEN